MGQVLYEIYFVKGGDAVRKHIAELLREHGRVIQESTIDPIKTGPLNLRQAGVYSLQDAVIAVKQENYAAFLMYASEQFRETLPTAGEKPPEEGLVLALYSTEPTGLDEIFPALVDGRDYAVIPQWGLGPVSKLPCARL